MVQSHIKVTETVPDLECAFALITYFTTSFRGVGGVVLTDQTQSGFQPYLSIKTADLNFN